MKNLTMLVTHEEIHSYARDHLLQSEPFRRSYDEKGFVYEQVDRYAWMPRLFAEETNERLERAHFSTWWNVIMLRQYSNPIINDLYYLHEMAHAATMPYFEQIGRKAFDEKMERNELEASVLSEIAVYFEMPQLRANSFDHPIYADRFLDQGDLRLLWHANRKVALDLLRFQRRDVMVSKPEQDMDLTEIWIRRFADQNRAYSVIWGDRYQEIEKRMAHVQKMSARAADPYFNPDERRGFRMLALKSLHDWLVEEAAKDSEDNVPFRLEAEQFALFYWSNKSKYEVAMRKAAEDNGRRAA